MENFMERTFMCDIFRKEIYGVLFECIDKECAEIMEENENDQNPTKINEILYSILNEEEFRYELLYEEFTNKPRFEDQIDCITYFDIVSIWNLIEYVRKQNNISKYMGDISNQTMIQKCSLAWAWIAEYIVENEWEDIIECYRNRNR